MNYKAMKYNALIDDLVSLAEKSHDFRESIVCTEASTTIRHLFNENERLTMELKHAKEAAASAKSEKFSLQSFILANLVPPEQQVYIYEHAGEQYLKMAWFGPFCALPDSYSHRTVEQVFVPIPGAPQGHYFCNLCFGPGILNVKNPLGGVSYNKIKGEIDAALAFHLLPRTAAAGLPNGSRPTPNSMGENRAVTAQTHILREQGFWLVLCSPGSTPVSLTSGADAARSILLPSKRGP